MSGRVKEVTDNSLEREVLQANKPVLVDFWAESSTAMLSRPRVVVLHKRRVSLSFCGRRLKSFMRRRNCWRRTRRPRAHDIAAPTIGIESEMKRLICCRQSGDIEFQRESNWQ